MKLSSVVLFVLGFQISFAQGYLFPINSGRPALLAGTMGELRSTHFHAGLDIHASIGEAVHAANDGYIYRATVATGGYGTVLYVRHPDGKGTVYAHLSEFVGPIAEYVLQERYKRKQSEIDLFLAPGQFPVSKGDVIAKSGNTGGSGGPHLHFELRDANEEALNPMTLNFEEVRDHTAPLPQRVALRTMDINSRINDQFGRFEFPVTKKGNSFVISQPVNASGHIGLEVLAYDRMENSSFRFGINLIELYANNEKIFTQKIEKISFAESRNILALVDYKTMETRGYRYNKLYVDDGNKLPFYDGTNLKKGITVKDEDVNLEIRLIDYNGNTSSIILTLKPAPESKTTDFDENRIRPVITDISGSVLTLNVTMCDPRDESAIAGGIQLYSNGSMRTLQPSYSARAHNVFLVDLNKYQPDSIVTCSGTWVSNFRDRIPSNTAYKYYSDLVDVEFPARSLYDTLFLSTAYDSTFRETFTVGTRMTPLQQSVHIQLRPLKSYPPSKSPGVYRVDHGGYTFMNSYWKNGKVGFNSLSLGQFTFLYDSVPPTARVVSLGSQAVKMKIRDELSGISYFEASINGEWLLMTYDYKTGLIYSERLDRSRPIRGEFELKVVDNAGNETIYKKRIP
ncbi:MAG: M23 family metallopeptidase [Bacteroidota bacterium]